MTNERTRACFPLTWLHAVRTVALGFMFTVNVLLPKWAIPHLQWYTYNSPMTHAYPSKDGVMQAAG